MTVQNFMKIVLTVFEKFEIFMKRSGDKKRHDCISSRKFFLTPKNCSAILKIAKLNGIEKDIFFSVLFDC